MEKKGTDSELQQVNFAFGNKSHTVQQRLVEVPVTQKLPYLHQRQECVMERVVIPRQTEAYKRVNTDITVSLKLEEIFSVKCRSEISGFKDFLLNF